jgi:hypothetical protein
VELTLVGSVVIQIRSDPFCFAGSGSEAGYTWESGPDPTYRPGIFGFVTLTS